MAAEIAMMELRPILSAMRRNKVGALLIATQIALTLAIISNALTLIEQRLSWSARPTGIDEANTFVVRSDSLSASHDLGARQSADIVTLRALAHVVDAFATNNYPLEGGGWSMAVALTAKQQSPSGYAGYYFGDAHALETLDQKLIAGRNFTADEILDRDLDHVPPAAGLIVTRALAMKLFPGGDALGKSIFVESDVASSPIIGIVEHLQGPFNAATGFTSTYVDNTVLAPYRQIGGSLQYVIRTRPGALAGVMQAAEAALSHADNDRVLDMKSMADVRAAAFRDNRGLTVLLASVCAVLLAVTGFGIVGLTSYWVAQRRRQIGIRRALGATRSAIVRYFQTENLLIATAGAAVGVGLSLALNLWMIDSFEMVRLELSHAVIGAVMIVILGQLAVLWPAMRAASIAPALATRGA